MRRIDGTASDAHQLDGLELQRQIDELREQQRRQGVMLDEIVAAIWAAAGAVISLTTSTTLHQLDDDQRLSDDTRQ